MGSSGVGYRNSAEQSFRIVLSLPGLYSSPKTLSMTRVLGGGKNRKTEPLMGDTHFFTANGAKWTQMGPDDEEW
jgi:hypothetical protein